MPTLEEKYPQFQSSIESARRAGHDDESIEQFVVEKIGATARTPEQQGRTFFEALQENIKTDPEGVFPSVVQSAFNVLDVPQDLITAAVSPGSEGFLSSFARGKDPSEALDLEGGVSKFAADVVLDPVNLLGGAGLLSKIGKAKRATGLFRSIADDGARQADEAAAVFKTGKGPQFKEFDSPADNILRQAVNKDEELQGVLDASKITHDEWLAMGDQAKDKVLQDVLGGVYDPSKIDLAEQAALKLNISDNIDDIFDIVSRGDSSPLVQATRLSKQKGGQFLRAERFNVPIEKAKLDRIRSRFNNMPDGPEKEAMAEILEQIGVNQGRLNPSTMEKFVEWSTMIKLTGLSSHVRGVIGNASMLFLRPLEKATAGSVSSARAAFLGKDKTVFAREAAAESMGMFKALPESVSKAWTFFKDPDDYFKEVTKAGEVLIQGGAIGKGGRLGGALEDFVSRTTGVGGIDAGGAVRLPGRLIGTMDVFFKHLNFNAEIAAQATRIGLTEGLSGDRLVKRVAGLVEDSKLRRGIGKKIAETADLSAKERVFQENLDGMAKTLNGLRKKHPISRLVVPFFNTPINLLKQSLQRSGPATLVLPSTWKTIKRGTEAEKVELIARSLSGSVFLAGAGYAAAQGRITGRGSKSRSRNDLRRLSGWQPNSVYANGTYVSYQGFEPLTSWFRTMGDLSDKVEEGENVLSVDGAGKLVASYAKQFAENPFLMGINDVFQALNDPETKASTFLAGLTTGSTIPVVLQQWGKTVYDPVVREPKSLGEKIASRVPFGGSTGVAPKRNIYGEEVVRDARGIPSAFGFTTSFEKGSPIDLELIRLSKGPDGITISKPTNKIFGFELNRDEHERLIVLRGSILKESLQKMIESDGYKKLNDGGRRRAVSRVVRRINDLSRKRIFGKYVSGRI